MRGNSLVRFLWDATVKSFHVESRRRQQNQTVRGNGTDSCPKGTSSKACAAMYLTRWLPGGKGLTRKAHGKPMVNLRLKRRETEAAKMGDDTQLVQNSSGIRGMRSQLACSSDRMMPGVEQVPKSLVIVCVKEHREAFMLSHEPCEKQGGRDWVEANALGSARDRGSFPVRKEADNP